MEGHSCEAVIETIVHSPEFAVRSASMRQAAYIPTETYRLPDALSRSPLLPRRVLVVGSCATEAFHRDVSARWPSVAFDRITFNNASALPPIEAEEARTYDFQVCQIPIRSVVVEGLYMNHELSEHEATHQFDFAVDRLRENFREITAYNRLHGMQTFVTNFVTPQQNMLGRMQGRYSLTNMVYFVERLNQVLHDLADSANDVHVVDLEQVVSTFGKRFVQDDSITHFNHGSTLSDDFYAAEDRSRIEPVTEISDLYAPQVGAVNVALFAEVLAAWRSLRQHEAVKLVIFDLDDTLWRGVAAERIDSLDLNMREGWPLGIVEAVGYLWRRGIMVAVCSKNDLDVVRHVFATIFPDVLSLDRFVAVKANWEPKPANVAEIMRLANVQPEAVLFVDDNPREREAVRVALPGVRTLEAPLAEWRRVLLWAPELQPAVITEEAKLRNASVRAMSHREADASTMDRAAFLASMDVRVAASLVEDVVSPHFARCLELINKTNQFNTNGRRWTEAELRELFLGSGYLVALHVADRLATYGLTAVAIVAENEVLQYLMSCRVFGLGVEHAAIGLCAEQVFARGHDAVRGTFSYTGKNRLAARLYADMGFEEQAGGLFTRGPQPVLQMPGHMVVDKSNFGSVA